jgi:hypothetical protein
MHFEGFVNRSNESITIEKEPINELDFHLLKNEIK